MTSRTLRSSLLAAALIIVPAAAYAESTAVEHSDGTESKATQADQKGAMEMNKGMASPSAKTTGSGMKNGGMNSPAQNATKKSRDDNKAYGKPDKH